MELATCACGASFLLPLYGPVQWVWDMADVANAHADHCAVALTHEASGERVWTTTVLSVVIHA